MKRMRFFSLDYLRNDYMEGYGQGEVLVKSLDSSSLNKSVGSRGDGHTEDCKQIGEARRFKKRESSKDYT